MFVLRQTVRYIYISQLVRAGRICSNFVQFSERHYKLTQRLIHQGFWHLRSSQDVMQAYFLSIIAVLGNMPAIDAFLCRNVTTLSLCGWVFM